ncbi:MAG: murein L,D-transpeptidase catalytic domain family protein [Ginsengibacter sp.]
MPVKFVTEIQKILPANENMSGLYLYDSLKLDNLGLSRQAFNEGIKGYNYLRSMGKLENDHVLSIVDFSLSSNQKRLFVIDMENLKLLFNTYVAHGRNSGKEFAGRFSNSPESNMSSLGFFITKNTYHGEHGLSLKLEGEEKGINDNAASRAIVIHCADYVSERTIKSLGYIGRSLGCPALPKKYTKPIIETIKDGSCLFLYSESQHYLSNSEILQQAS